MPKLVLNYEELKDRDKLERDLKKMARFIRYEIKIDVLFKKVFHQIIILKKLFKANVFSFNPLFRKFTEYPLTQRDLLA